MRPAALIRELIVQTAACVVLLVMTALMIRTFVRLQSEPLGFHERNLFVADVVLPNEAFDSSETRNLYYRHLADRIRVLPGIRGVAAGTSRPLNSGPPVTVHTGPEDAVNAPRISAQAVTNEFFETLGIRRESPVCRLPGRVDSRFRDVLPRVIPSPESASALQMHAAQPAIDAARGNSVQLPGEHGSSGIRQHHGSPKAFVVSGASQSEREQRR
jgi:hypothetical protein